MESIILESTGQEKCQVIKEKPLDGDEKSISENEEDKEIVIECYICQAFFSQNRTLKAHIASVHESKKPFKCSACDYIYKCSQKTS